MAVYSKILSLINGVPRTTDLSQSGNALGLSSLQLLGSTSGHVQFNAASATTSYSLVLPSAQGAASTFLQNDGSGNLSWSIVTSSSAISNVFTAGQAFSANTSYIVRWGMDALSETTSRIYAADYSTVTYDEFWAVGIAFSSVAVLTGQPVSVYSFGAYTLGSSDTPFNSSDVGDPVWLTAAGSFSTTAPTGISQADLKIGIVMSTTQIWIDGQMMGVGNVPTGAGPNPLEVSEGGTGLNTLDPYAILAGGTTGTDPMQQVSGLGTAGDVLTSNGAGALPTWQAAGSSGANTALSNLASVAINTSLLPGSTGIDLGNASFPFDNIYLQSSASGPNGTIQQNGQLLLHTFGDSTSHSDFFAGYEAGNLTMSNANNKNNTGVGSKALNALTTGKDNVAVGTNTLALNTSGQQNIAIGSKALPIHVSGNQNIAIGYQALTVDTNGSDNISIGGNSLSSCDGGSDNIAIGSNAINGLTNGTMNVSVGRQSADSIVSGSGNTFIGDASGSGAPNVGTGDTNNSTAIGTYSVAWTDNALVLGAINGQGNASFDTNVGIGTSTPNNMALLTIDTTMSSPSPGFVPMVMVPGTLAGSPISGAIENDGTNLYYTNSSPTRQTLLTTASGANTALSNLASTAVNVDLSPGGTTDTLNFGSATKVWHNAFIHNFNDQSDVLSLNTLNRTLNAADASISLAYNTRNLITTGNVSSLDWENSLLLGATGVHALAWSDSNVTVKNLVISPVNGGQGITINGSTSGDVFIRASATTTTYPLVLPSAQGGASTILTNDGSGNLSWGTASAGTVTSVALADISSTPIYTITNSPVTSSGTLDIALNTQSANTVFSGPTTGSAAEPTFRSLVSADIPSLSSIYLPLAGGTMSGNIAMGANKLTGLSAGSTAGDSVRYEQAILVSGVNSFTADQSMGSNKLTNLANGTNSNDAVNYSQLQAITSGLIWLPSIQDPDLVDDSLSSPPGSPLYSITYIIAATPSGAWAGLAGHAVWWDGANWIDLSTGNTAASGFGTAVQVGDRFAVAIGTAGAPAYIGGGLTGKANNIAQVTSNTPGSFTYTFTAPSASDAVSVTNVNSQHYGSSFTYNSALTSWVDFSGPSKVVSGSALAYSGNTLNVLYDGVTIDLTSNKLEVKSGGISNTQIATGAAIAYSKLNLTGNIVNADINASAAIAYSKLNLAGDIVNADINASAAIAYSKLNLTGDIVNADINASAAIDYSKLNLSNSIVNADISSSAAIANSKLAQMAGHTYKGNNTGSTASPSDITSTQLTADLNLFTSSLQGLVPSSGGGTSNFLRADGTFAVPPGTGVTAVSVASANGFAGSSSGGSTPALTISTSITGILQGNGTAISAATTTGSGSVVLATSPTLVTPALGTPSAAVLTNATGLPLTTGVTGVLPSANVGLTRTINAQTGTTYTFVLSDGSAAGGNPLVTASNASAQTYTVPLNSSVAYPVGTQIDILQQGAGKVTIAATGGVTINSKGGNLSISAQYVGVSLVKLATDTWTLIGDLIA